MKKALSLFLAFMLASGPVLASDPKAAAIKTVTSAFNGALTGADTDVQRALNTLDDAVAGGAPVGATYITQTANATLTNEQALGSLATGIVKNTTTTGVLSIAAAGTDYLAPAAIGVTVQGFDTDLSTYASITPSANVQTLLGSADNSAARTNLGLAIGTNVQAFDADLSTYAGITPSANVQSLLGAADYSAMRTLLGLVIGTNIQAYDSDLTTWAGLTPSAFFQTLVDDADATTVRATLGSVIGTNVEAWDADLDDLADGSLTGSKVSSAAADGTTLGVASFTAADFNSSSGNISIDYTNGQAAATGVKGFLTGTDWDTFNAKQSVLTNSAGLRGALSDENGTGVALFDGATSASFVTPAIGAATGTSLALSGAIGQLGGSTGATFSAASGVVTIAGIGNTNNENITANFEGVSNQVTFGSGTGVTQWNVPSLVSTNSTFSSNSIVSGGSLTASGFSITNSTITPGTISRTGNNSSGTNQAFSASATNPNSTGAGGAQALIGTALISSSTGGNTGTIQGVRGIGQYSSTGTQVDAYGVYGIVQKITSATGSITDAYSIYGDTPTASGGGTITRSWSAGFPSAVQFGTTTGVKVSAATGKITWTGIGNTNNEDLSLDLETTSNTGILTSSTGLATLSFSGIAQTTDGNLPRSTKTTDAGYAVVAGANTACNTTCTSACIFGFDQGTLGAVVGSIVACTDATADQCLCAGAS